MVGVVRDLAVGEAERRQAGGEVGLVPLAILRLLGRSAVVGEPVGLDDESEIRPEEVDAMTRNRLLGEGKAEAGSGDEADLLAERLRVDPIQGPAGEVGPPVDEEAGALRCSRPVRTLCRIASLLKPRSRSCRRVTRPC